MKGEERLLRVIGDIGETFVQEAAESRPAPHKSRKGWIAAAAACLCLLVLWQGGILSPRGGDSPGLPLWKEEFPPPEVFFEGLAQGGNTGGENAAPAPEETPVSGSSSAQTVAPGAGSTGPAPVQTEQETVVAEADTSHIWKEGFPPESYFIGAADADGSAGGGSSSANAEPGAPGEEGTVLTPLAGMRKELENRGLIPSMTGWNEFYGFLTEEEKRTELWIQWIRTDPADPPWLSVSVSAGEGCTVKQNGVLNQREGVFIFADGAEDSPKQLSYERDGVFTTISGSGKVSYGEMVRVLDWYWEHPQTLEEVCSQKEEMEK